MRELVATWTPSEVEVWGTRYRVPRPSVRQAMTVFVGIEAEDWDLLTEVSHEWLPRGLAFGLCRAQDMGMLGELITFGLPDAERHDRNEKAVREKARSTSWFEVLSDYAATFGTSVPDVLATPWPLFVATAALRDRIHAQQELRSLSWYAAAKTGKAQSIVERAGMSEVAEEMTDEERLDRQQQNLSDIQRQWAAVRGRA